MATKVRDEPIHIYALCSSEDRRPRYVGQSVDPIVRLAQHCAPTAAPRVRRWATAVRDNGFAVVSETLCILPSGHDADDMEQAFIAMFDDLLNDQRRQRGRTEGASASVGSRRFRAVVRDLGSNVVSRLLGADGALVSRWSRGVGCPGADWRLAIVRELGIPFEDWSLAASPVAHVSHPASLPRLPRGLQTPHCPRVQEQS
jgi:hypothetical protein